MSKKLVVVAHGVGDNTEGFHERWAEILNANHPGNQFEVVGFLWDDVLDQVSDKYPIISRDFAEAIAKFNLPQIEQIVDHDGYRMLHEFLMDAVVYTALDDMREFIITTCGLRLKKITRGRERDTILIGHSLGSVMLPHLVWKERNESLMGIIPYYALMMLASPIGLESPIPSMVDDFLTIMARINGGDRYKVLRRFAGAWRMKGEGRLHIILNRTDPVCSDVKVQLGEFEKDLIPVRQGLNDEEKLILDEANEGCVSEFETGSRDPLRIVSNHLVEVYLNSEPFKHAFHRLITNS